MKTNVLEYPFKKVAHLKVFPTQAFAVNTAKFLRTTFL